MDRDPASRRPHDAVNRPRRQTKRRLTWSDAELDTDPHRLLAPMVERLTELSNEQRFEEAAAIRDEAEHLRHLLETRRRVKSLRDAGRVTIIVDGKHPVELDCGLLVRRMNTLATGNADQDRDCTVPMNSASCDNERIIVANWIERNSTRVRILDVESPVGLSVPSGAVPVLPELFDPRCTPTGDDHAGRVA